jgi:RHS repeat-associated protein
LAAAVVLTSTVVKSRAPIDPSSGAFGLASARAERGSFSHMPFERVDPISGNLTLSFTDLALPGNAGMDLRITRTYSHQRDGDQWKFSFVGVPTLAMIPSSGDPSLYNADGSQELLHAGVVDGYRITTGLAKWETSTRTLYLPNGWIATYDAPGAYSEHAWLHEVHDPYGNSITPTWASPGRIGSVTQQVDDGGGTRTRTVTFSYGSLSQPASMSYAGRTWYYSYESSGAHRLTAVQPPAGPGWAFSYGSGSLTVTTPSGGTVAYSFTDEDGRAAVHEITTGGRAITSGTWSFDYAPSGSTATTTVTTPSDRDIVFVHEWTEGPDGKQWVLTDRSLIDGSTTVQHVEREYHNTAFLTGLPLKALASQDITQDGVTFTTAYDYSGSNFDDFLQPDEITESASNHSATRVTSRSFTTISSVYMARRVSEVTVAMGSASFSQSMSYDSTGFMTSQTSGGITMTFARDDWGNGNSVTDPASHTNWVESMWGVPKNAGTNEYVIYRNVNADGSLSTEARGWGGPVTYYTYDDAGRLTQVDPPGATAIATAYASDGSYTTVTRGVSSVVTTVDGFGRPIATENAEAVKTVTTYDNEGRKTYQSAPFTGSSHSGNHFEYDALGRVTVITHADDSDVTYSYSGTDVTITDENSHATTQHWQVFGSPGNGRLTSVTDPASQTWTYSYNVFGSLTRVQQSSAPDRVWTYDSNNRLTSETQPESGTTYYDYNSDGLLYCKTDALDHTTTFTYDGAHRLLTVNAPGTSEDVSFTYDARDNRLTTTMAASETTFTYDGSNRLTARADEIAGHAFSTTFDYDGRDNLTKITYPSGRQIQYAYDYANRITQVYSGSTIYADGIAYHPTGALSALEFGNGTDEALTLNGRFRPAHLTSGPLDLTYSYDYAGNVSAIDDARSGYDSGFTYDALDRLTEVTGYGNGTFAYDAQGNRTSKSVGLAGSVTYSYSSTTNRLTSASSSIGAPETGTFSYDATGSMTADGTGTYAYTSRNQMASSTISSATTNYTYNADGLRTIKASPTKTTYYVHAAGGMVLAEYTPTEGTPSLDREYVYLGSRLLASLVPNDDEPEAVAAVTGITTSSGSITVGGSVTATVSGESLPCAQVKVTWGDGNSASYPLSSPYALPIAPNHTYSTAGLYTIVAEGESGCGGKVSIPVEVRSAQIISNGDFSGGNNSGNTAPANWDFYSDGSGVVWGLAGYLGFYRSSDSTYGVLEQVQTLSLPAGAPLEATFKLANTASFGRQMYVYIRSSDWSDRALCTFYLPASQSLTTYTMRTHTTVAWTSAVIDFYMIDASTNAFYIDDVSLVYAPANSSAKTDCVDPNAPTSGGSTSSNLLSNGTFATDTSGWTVTSTLQHSVSSGVLNFYGATSASSPWPSLSQSTGSMSANQRFAAIFELGNASASLQAMNVMVYASDGTTIGCIFHLPAGSPRRPYAVLTYAPAAWSSASAYWYPGFLGTESTHGWLQLDNVSIAKVTTATVGISCLEPGSFTVGGGAPEPAPEPIALTAHVETPRQPKMRTVIYPIEDVTRATVATTETPDGSTSDLIPPPAALWTMTLQGAGTGTVTSSPTGIACSGHDLNCVGMFVENTTITFTATPASGDSFGGWGGACSGITTTCIVSGVGNQTVTATFHGPPTVTYYHADVLGSVRAITDAAGDPVTRLDYFPFGEGGGSGIQRGFIGLERDAETTFDQMGARYYRNVWGRFTSVDPIFSGGAATNPQLWNRYAYGLNNPLRFMDPLGMEPEDLGDVGARQLSGYDGISDFSYRSFNTWAEGLYTYNMLLAYEAGIIGADAFLNIFPLGTRDKVLDALVLSSSPIMCGPTCVLPAGHLEAGFSANTFEGGQTEFSEVATGRWTPFGQDPSSPFLAATSSDAFMFHTHPGAAAVSITYTNGILQSKVSTTTSKFRQAPDQGDFDFIGPAGYRFGIVAALGENKVYFYTRFGIVGKPLALQDFLGGIR